MDVFATVPWLPPQGRRVPIPYVGSAEYTISSQAVSRVSDIPRLAEFQFWEVGSGVRRGYSPSVKRLAQLLQTWLFFGLLSDYFQTPLDPLSFGIDDEVFAQRKGLRYLHRIAQNAAGWIPAYSKEWSRLYALLDHAQSECERIEFAAAGLRTANGETREDDDDDEWTQFTSIALSVKLLLDLLSDGLKMWFNTGWSYNYSCHLSKLRPLPEGSSRISPATEMLLLNFERSKWCPQRARYLCTVLDYRACNYLSSLEFDSSPEAHVNCLEAEKCVAFDIDESNYSMPHHETCDGTEDECDWIIVPQDELAQTISSGHIPMITINRRGSLDLSITPLMAKSQYIAISHVWSDGLGNPIFNGLRRCQLVQLRSKILQLLKFNKVNVKDRIQFWMDTLCIPVGMTGLNNSTAETPNSSQPLRRAAIQQISTVFTGATYTLVLDRELETEKQIPIPFHYSSHEPDGLRGLRHRRREPGAMCPTESTYAAGILLGSTWMQRAWTLEEGYSGQETVCKFRNQFVSIRAMEMDLFMENHDLVREEAPTEAVMMHYKFDVRKFLCETFFGPVGSLESDNKPMIGTIRRMHRPKRGSDAFVAAWNAMVSRSTSKKTDEPIIFASLMNFDPSTLRLLPPHKRLSTVIRNCQHLPLSLLYGVRNPEQIEWLPDRVVGRINAQGPEIKLTEFQISVANQTSRMASIELYDSDNVFSYIIPTDAIPPSGKLSMRILEEVWMVESLFDHSTSEQSRPPLPGTDQFTCIILDTEAGTRSLSGWRARGVRFNVKQRSDKSLCVDFHCAIVARNFEQVTSQRVNSNGDKKFFPAEVRSERFGSGSPYRPQISLIFNETAVDLAGRTEHTLWNFQPVGNLLRLIEKPIPETPFLQRVKNKATSVAFNLASPLIYGMLSTPDD